MAQQHLVGNLNHFGEYAVLTKNPRFPDSQNVGALKLDSWIRGIDWVSELSFALAGRSRDYWYAQQLSIATMVFSVFVGVEGKS